MKWSPQHKDDFAPKVINFEVDGAVVKNPIPEGQVMEYHYILLLEREIFSEVTIVLNTSKGSIQAFIPAQETIPWNRVKPENVSPNYLEPTKEPSSPLEKMAERWKELEDSGEDF